MLSAASPARSPTPFVLCPLLHRRRPHQFTKALWLSIVPQMAVQCHMAFGSTSLFDHHFNVAHGLKIVAYAVPLLGLLLDYMETHRLQKVHLDTMTLLTRSLDEKSRHVESVNATLKRQAMELLQAKVQADSASAGKSAFVANMSHEIRTPLTAILGFTKELVRPDLEDAERVEFATIIYQNAEHLLQILNDVLDLSKIEAGELRVEQLPCSPTRIVSGIASLLRPRSIQTGVRLEVRGEGDIPESITSDPTRLRQILLNLLSNALKFTAEGSIGVTLRLHVTDETKKTGEGLLEFEVTDTGIGFTKEQVGKIFQPFVQADDTTTRRFGGTGLGLTICIHLAHRLGGGLTAESRPEGGSAFRLTVATGPLQGVRLRPVDELIGERVAPTASDLDALRLEGRVLIAEDNTTNQALIRRMLERAGLVVLVTPDGHTAVEEVKAALAREEPYDLIVMDMQMPILDGYGATAALRRLGPHVPIIALTASALLSDRERCLRVGCDDFATKPVDRNTFLHIVASHLPDNRRESPTASC